MGEVFKRKLAIDPPARVFELLANISAHDVAEGVHGLTTGEYLAKTSRSDQLVQGEIAENIKIYLKPLMQRTTTSTVYTDIDDGAFEFPSAPYLQFKRTEVYISAFIYGTDLGVQLMKDGEVVETREWTGTKWNQFFFYKMTERLWDNQVCSVKIRIKTTSTEGTLSRFSKLMIIVDRGMH